MNTLREQMGNFALNLRQPILNALGATYQLSNEQSGAMILLDRAAGQVITLPAISSSIVGHFFDFVVVTSVTSNNHKVITPVGTVFLQGVIKNVKTDLTQLNSIADGSTIVAITMNGTTTGGLVGTRLRFIAVSTTEWQVFGENLASGTIATPFTTS
jgi:hypothetical protein